MEDDDGDVGNDGDDGDVGDDGDDVDDGDVERAALRLTRQAKNN